MLIVSCSGKKEELREGGKNCTVPAIVTVCAGTNINFGDVVCTFRDGRILAPRVCYPQLSVLWVGNFLYMKQP